MGQGHGGFVVSRSLLEQSLATLPEFNMVHLKMAPLNGSFRLWKPSCLGSMSNLDNLGSVPFLFISYPSIFTRQSRDFIRSTTLVATSRSSKTNASQM